MKVLKFFANWCKPCKKLSFNIHCIKSEITYPVEEINVDTNRELAARYNISALPTMILIDDDKEVRRITGLPPKQELRSFFDLK
jgi:thioredoxin 1